MESDTIDSSNIRLTPVSISGLTHKNAPEQKEDGGILFLPGPIVIIQSTTWIALLEHNAALTTLTTHIKANPVPNRTLW